MRKQLGVEAASDGDRGEGAVGCDDVVEAAGLAFGDEGGAVVR